MGRAMIFYTYWTLGQPKNSELMGRQWENWSTWTRLQWSVKQRMSVEGKWKARNERPSDGQKQRNKEQRRRDFFLLLLYAIDHPFLYSVTLFQIPNLLNFTVIFQFLFLLDFNPFLRASSFAPFLILRRYLPLRFLAVYCVSFRPIFLSKGGNYRLNWISYIWESKRKCRFRLKPKANLNHNRRLRIRFMNPPTPQPLSLKPP